MACPVHIWIPLMAAAVPTARAVRSRLKIALDARRVNGDAASTPRAVKRWAPVGTQNVSVTPEQEQPRSL